MEIQLRDYRILDGQMDEWISRWSAGVVPIREAIGFEILGAWADRANSRFVWLVGYSGADGFAAAEERYHASPERLALFPEPSELIEAATLDMVDDVRA